MPFHKTFRDFFSLIYWITPNRRNTRNVVTEPLIILYDPSRWRGLVLTSCNKQEVFSYQLSDNFFATSYSVMWRPLKDASNLFSFTASVVRESCFKKPYAALKHSNNKDIESNSFETRHLYLSLLELLLIVVIHRW